jgi:salicylate hydroxylase
MKIVIIGSGVAGSIVAHGLRDAPGVTVTALERVGPRGHDDAGTGLNVGPNALTALRRTLPSLHAAMRAASLEWRRWPVWLTDGAPLMDLDLLDVAEEYGVRIRWSDLYRLLRAPIADLVRWRVEVARIDDDGAGGLRVETRDLETGAVDALDQVDLLIAADGRYSRVREARFGAPQPTFYGAALYRLLLPDTADGAIDDYGQWFNGPHRLLSFRVPGDLIYVAGSFPIAPDEAITDAVKTPEFLRACYTPADRPPDRACRWMIDAIADNVAAIHWSRLQDIAPLHSDESGRVLLLGDAGHGMVPTLGQGATQSVEDACAAVKAIRETLKDGGDARDVTARYVAARAERINFVMDLSRRSSDTLLAGADPVAGTRWKTEAPYLAELKRLYIPPNPA